jgi:dihydrofolate reductase
LFDLPAESGDYGYAAFMETVDGIVMGRGSYEKVLSFDEWPYAKPVVVMSRSLAEGDIPARLAGKVRISDLEPRALMDALAEEGWEGAYIDGGKLIQSFLREGLISDFTLSRIPVLLGSGIPLFGPLDADIKLQHVETSAYGSGLVQSRYRIGD